MSFSRREYDVVNKVLHQRREKAEADAEYRLKKAYSVLPELERIDRQLSGTVGKLCSAFGGSHENFSLRFEEIRDENLALQAKRAEILRDAGYPEDYTEPRYFCSECRDTGFVGTKECVCRKRALILAGYENSGIGELLKTQTFETFSLSDVGEKTAAAYAKLREFADTFSGKNDGNFLLVGGTGLGKTHLSTATAGVIIERGFDVKYETAQNMFSEFERWKFHRRDGDEDLTERFFSCDLLVVDDLGAELSNQFTKSCLYNLVNDRINKRRSTIVSTNYGSRALENIYGDRIVSRLFGEYEAVLFDGRDARMKKFRK